MKLVETGPLAKDLEIGLGEVHWLLGGINKDARLGMAVCGIVSIALSHTLSSQGIEHELVISKPNLDVDPDKEHVFLVLEDGNSGTIIDATYAQFYDYAGLNPGYISMSGRSRFFPHEKIVSFPVGEHQRLVQQMSLQARYFINHYEPVDDLSFQKIDFKDFDEDQIAEQYSRIWMPENIEHFVPTVQTEEAGKRLAAFIVPGHVKLVA
jgi:hypothetical protein